MTASPVTSTQTVILSPSYRLPISIGVIALVLGSISLWVTLPLLVFALFLGGQAATLRLHFAPTALEIYRGQTQIRYFPYVGWYHWEIYWPVVPILFYFREVNSIHFLPVLFDPSALAQCLRERCPRQTS